VVYAGLSDWKIFPRRQPIPADVTKASFAGTTERATLA
jgi:hypothetical protein